ncbi:MAG: glycosyltransferase family 4 protein [candidate division Zixibacteria bacterium]|nr:glycosyltransferase family 4 protein [candidate division Zixibacteria bacterium]
MRKYKVLFLNSIHENVWGGGENLIYNFATHLVRRGHKIWVAGRKGSEFLSPFTGDDINLIPLKIRGDFDPWNIFFLSRFMLKEKIDFLWVNFNKDLRMGGIASLSVPGVKIIWGMGVCLPRTSLLHKITGRYLVDKIVVPSQSLKDQLKRFPWIGQDRVEVILNGIDLSCFDLDIKKARDTLFQRYKIDAKQTLIGVPARLVKAKGHQYLLRALPEVIQFFPDIKLFIAGDGPEKSNLEELSDQLKLGDYVIFAGYLKEIFETMAGFDLLVLPSVIEPFGLVLAEGMALQKPIVATRVGGIPEVVEDKKTGILVPPENPHALAQAIVKLLKDKSLASQLGRIGRERVEKHFTIDKMIERIEEMFGEMSANK